MNPLSREKLEKLGLNKNQINKIFTNYSIENLKDETLSKYIDETINYFKELGFLQNQVIVMIIQYPQILALKPDTFSNKITNFKNIGYKDKEIYKLILNNPGLLLYSEEKITEKISDLEKLGYSKDQILKMSLKLETLFVLDVENNIKKKLKDMIKLGFTEEELLYMTLTHPDIFSYNIEKIKNTIENIEKLVYSKEITKHLIYNLPAILGLSLENVKNKIEFIKEINALDEIIKCPKNLIISLKVIYARYMYFKENNITFSSNDRRNYWLFVGHQKFEERFSISKIILLNKYNYKECCEEQKNEKTK